MNLNDALTALQDGRPGSNDAALTAPPSDSGAIQEVQELLAQAACVVLLSCNASDAFTHLSHFLDTAARTHWFGARRAELVLEMVLYRAGGNLLSVWNAERERHLALGGGGVDDRWCEVCVRVARSADMEVQFVTEEGIVLRPALRSIADALQLRLRSSARPQT